MSLAESPEQLGVRHAVARLAWESPSSADLLCPGYSRSWDLNKICYKSGIPLIENGMIERVSTLSYSLRWGQGGTFSAAGEGSRRWGG